MSVDFPEDYGFVDPFKGRKDKKTFNNKLAENHTKQTEDQREEFFSIVNSLWTKEELSNASSLFGGRVNNEEGA